MPRKEYHSPPPSEWNYTSKTSSDGHSAGWSIKNSIRRFMNTQRDRRAGRVEDSDLWKSLDAAVQPSTPSNASLSPSRTPPSETIAIPRRIIDSGYLTDSPSSLSRNVSFLSQFGSGPAHNAVDLNVTNMEIDEDDDYDTDMAEHYDSNDDDEVFLSDTDIDEVDGDTGSANATLGADTAHSYATSAFYANPLSGSLQSHATSSSPVMFYAPVTETSAQTNIPRVGPAAHASHVMPGGSLPLPSMPGFHGNALAAGQPSILRPIRPTLSVPQRMRGPMRTLSLQPRTENPPLRLRPRHFSEGHDIGRDRIHSTPQSSRIGEAMDEEMVTPPRTFRDRAYSEPAIQTRLQRDIGRELRRISDEFHESYRQPHGGEASSYPGRQRRRSSWWQNIIQMIPFTRPWPEQSADDTDSETEQDGDDDFLPDLHDEVDGLPEPKLL